MALINNLYLFRPVFSAKRQHRVVLSVGVDGNSGNYISTNDRSSIDYTNMYR